MTTGRFGWTFPILTALQTNLNKIRPQLRITPYRTLKRPTNWGDQPGSPEVPQPWGQPWGERVPGSSHFAPAMTVDAPVKTYGLHKVPIKTY